MTRKTRRYSELILLPTFDERFGYLSIGGKVGIETFGGDRVFNQMFYTSSEWLAFRDKIITRDMGCDLGCLDHEIPNGVPITIHHLVPLVMDDIKYASEYLLNPEYAITTTHQTHMAIHYGNKDYLERFTVVERKPNDTCPWRSINAK